MAEKLPVSIEAQLAWGKAKNVGERIAVVQQYPELRYLFAAASEIYASLSTKAPTQAPEPTAT